jgi:hypothetical protein
VKQQYFIEWSGAEQNTVSYNRPNHFDEKGSSASFPKSYYELKRSRVQKKSVPVSGKRRRISPSLSRRCDVRKNRCGTAATPNGRNPAGGPGADSPRSGAAPAFKPRRLALFRFGAKRRPPEATEAGRDNLQRRLLSRWCAVTDGAQPHVQVRTHPFAAFAPRWRPPRR